MQRRITAHYHTQQRNYCMRNSSLIIKLKLYNMLKTSLKTLTLITLLHTRMHVLFAYNKRIDFFKCNLISFFQKTLLKLLPRCRFESLDTLLQNAP